MGAERSTDGSLGVDRELDRNGFDAGDLQRGSGRLVHRTPWPSLKFWHRLGNSEYEFERELHDAGIAGTEDLPG